ncbi:MAG: LbtU family siderophore porin [Magnetococcales bacterium]|nr:LbtU family siderophore porin [Magnetococcales bacterium]NGZ06970.1 LbtU family siderophore porin [Magnetococcales bacterium]
MLIHLAMLLTAIGALGTTSLAQAETLALRTEMWSMLHQQTQQASSEPHLALEVKSPESNGQLYAFTGLDKRESGIDSIQQFGAHLGFDGRIRSMSLDLGGSLLNFQEESDPTASPTLEEQDRTLFGTTSLKRQLSGVGLHAQIGYSGLTVSGDFLTARDRHHLNESAVSSRATRMNAWNLGAGYQFQVLGKETQVAAAWQGSDDALAIHDGTLGVPENRLKVGLSMGIFDHTTLALEWMHDKESLFTDGSLTGTPAITNTGKVKLALEF